MMVSAASGGAATPPEGLLSPSFDGDLGVSGTRYQPPRGAVRLGGLAGTTRFARQREWFCGRGLPRYLDFLVFWMSPAQNGPRIPVPRGRLPRGNQAATGSTVPHEESSSSPPRP